MGNRFEQNSSAPARQTRACSRSRTVVCILAQLVSRSGDTCWIALNDAEAENGALRYIAGSHRNTLGLSVDEQERFEDIDKLIAEGDKRIAAVRASSAFFTTASHTRQRAQQQRSHTALCPQHYFHANGNALWTQTTV